jgi:hypothetical protein
MMPHVQLTSAANWLNAGGLGQQTVTGSNQQAYAGLRIVILDELDGLMGAKPTLQVGT